MGTRFSACPDRSWGPPSLLYNGYRVFPGGRGGGRGGRDAGLTPHPHLECRCPRKSRAIPLLTLRAFVACKKGENLNNTARKDVSLYSSRCNMFTARYELVCKIFDLHQFRTLKVLFHGLSFQIPWFDTKSVHM